MTITTEELARIRDIAEADRNGADGKAWDEAITPDTVIALCDIVEALKEKWQEAVSINELRLAECAGELVRRMTEATGAGEMKIKMGVTCVHCNQHFTSHEEAIRHDAVCPKHPANIRSERLERKAYLLEQSNLWIAAVAFNGTASDYGSLYGLVEAAHEAVRGGGNETERY